MITYSERGDILYVQLTEEVVASTSTIDDLRIVDYDQAGGVVGVEFLSVSGGLSLKNLPERSKLEELIRKLQFPIYA